GDVVGDVEFQHPGHHDDASRRVSGGRQPVGGEAPVLVADVEGAVVDDRGAAAGAADVGGPQGGAGGGAAAGGVPGADPAGAGARGGGAPGASTPPARSLT